MIRVEAEVGDSTWLGSALEDIVADLMATRGLTREQAIAELRWEPR